MAEITNRIRTLPADALDPAAMTVRLRAALAPPAALETWRVVGVEVLQDEPERDYALAYTVEGAGGRRRLVARIVGNDGEEEFRRLCEIAAWLGSRGVRVPRPLLFLPGHGMLISEFVEGTSLAAALYDGGTISAGTRIGTATARLHQAPDTGGLVPGGGPQDAIRRTATWEDAMTAADQRRRFGRLLGTLNALALTLPPVPATPVHGKLMPERFREEHGETVLLFPGAPSNGDPFSDVGSLRAFLIVRAAQNPELAAACRQAASVFLECYLAVRELSAADLSERIRFYDACALLRLAGVYGTRERWKQRLPPVLLTSVELLLENGETR